MLKILSLIAIKFTSVFLIAYTLLFILVAGNLEQVGIYASASAILAPISMFCSFRYIEWIALSNNKQKAFSVSLFSAIGIYLLLSIPIFLFLQTIIHNNQLFIFFAILYKPLEMIADYYRSLLASLHDLKGAMLSTISRVIFTVSISITSILYLSKNAILIASCSLVFANILALVLLDMPKMLTQKHLTPASLPEIADYTKDNVRFGLLNMMVSINSSIPRYYLTALNEMSTLGLFSLIYQAAATAVNLLQYPISIKIAAIHRNIRQNAKMLFNGFIFITFNVGIFLLIQQSDFFVEHNWQSKHWSNYVFIAYIISIMSIAVLFRSFLLSLNIAEKSTKEIHFSIFTASLFTLLILSLGNLVNISTSPFLNSCLFVIISAYLSAVILLKSLKDNGFFSNNETSHHRE